MPVFFVTNPTNNWVLCHRSLSQVFTSEPSIIGDQDNAIIVPPRSVQAFYGNFYEDAIPEPIRWGIGSKDLDLLRPTTIRPDHANDEVVALNERATVLINAMLLNGTLDLLANYQAAQEAVKKINFRISYERKIYSVERPCKDRPTIGELVEFSDIAFRVHDIHQSPIGSLFHSSIEKLRDDKLPKDAFEIPG